MSRIFEFSGFKVDVEKRELYSPANQTVYLNSRSFDCLLFLVENRGQIISKQDLLDGIWKNQIVEENNISQAIFNIRKALGDSKANSRFVQTVQGAGYSFIADVSELDEMPELTDSAETADAGMLEKDSLHARKKALMPFGLPHTLATVAFVAVLVLGIVYLLPVFSGNASEEVSGANEQAVIGPQDAENPLDRTRQGGVSAAEMLFRNDTNQDGVVTREEALALDSRLAQVFDIYDLNKDGKIVFEELTTVLASRE